MKDRNEIEIGLDPKLNNLKVFRKVAHQPFLPNYSFNEDDTLSQESSITVNYLEYYKNTNNEIIDELTRHKNYIVIGTRAINWFLTLARTPVTIETGIMDEIEYVLSIIPMNSEESTII